MRRFKIRVASGEYPNMTAKPKDLERATIGVGGQGFRALGAGENLAYKLMKEKQVRDDTGSQLYCLNEGSPDCWRLLIPSTHLADRPLPPRRRPSRTIKK